MRASWVSPCPRPEATELRQEPGPAPPSLTKEARTSVPPQEEIADLPPAGTELDQEDGRTPAPGLPSRPLWKHVFLGEEQDVVWWRIRAWAKRLQQVIKAKRTSSRSLEQPLEDVELERKGRATDSERTVNGAQPSWRADAGCW